MKQKHETLFFTSALAAPCANAWCGRGSWKNKGSNCAKVLYYMLTSTSYYCIELELTVADDADCWLFCLFRFHLYFLMLCMLLSSCLLPLISL